MNTQFRPHLIKKRNTVVKLKIKGWRAAVEKNLVPERYQNDIDTDAIEARLIEIEQKLNELEASGQLEDAQAQKLIRDLNAEERQVRSDTNKEADEIREEYRQICAGAKKKRDEQLKKLADRKKSTLEDLSQRKKKAQEPDMNAEKTKLEILEAHNALGASENELDGLIRASFSAPGDKKMIDAIRRGEIEV